MLTYMAISFTNFGPDPYTKSYIGYLFIALNGLILLVQIYLLFRSSFKALKRWLRKKCYKHKTISSDKKKNTTTHVENKIKRRPRITIEEIKQIVLPNSIADEAEQKNNEASSQRESEPTKFVLNVEYKDQRSLDATRVTILEVIQEEDERLDSIDSAFGAKRQPSNSQGR